MGDKIRRYIMCCYEGITNYMQPHPEGGWVKYEDIAHLLVEEKSNSAELLKSEIAALASGLQCRKDSGLCISHDYVIKRLRQLSAV